MSKAVCQYCWGKGCHYCGGKAVEEPVLVPKDLPAVCYKCNMLFVCMGESRQRCVEVNHD